MGRRGESVLLSLRFSFKKARKEEEDFKIFEIAKSVDGVEGIVEAVEKVLHSEFDYHSSCMESGAQASNYHMGFENVEVRSFAFPRPGGED